ncbi:MAG TPA: DNA repair protein RadA [Steroidobacteraceae bacterium]|nr:DNA repair protein RadA [Steroidobacteraceae bacterium]
MARNQPVFICSSCGGEALKWQGQCPHCAAWNTLSRLSGIRAAAGGSSIAVPPALAVALASDPAPEVRLSLGAAELDRVFGGGLGLGSVSLLGGEPGIGKSTLLLQVAAALGRERPVLYASGEESTQQTTQRARRLGLVAPHLVLASENSLEAILALSSEHQAALLVVDSIQTMQTSSVESSPGTVQQLRECTAALVRFAKYSGTAVIIVGHVTKDGTIAGPKLLEHLVDTVLYFDADAGSRYRMLRATKNRFGPVNELGFFAMSEAGLREVPNPSAIFLSRHAQAVPGSLVMVARDGGRPLLIEVQALVDRTRFATPRRVAEGVDANRLGLLLAVMSRHAGLGLGDYDVYVNLVGGLQIAETATDLPLALALASSLRGEALDGTLVAFGELGLTGEVRPVPYGEERLRELHKQGYARAILPRKNCPRAGVPGVQLHPVETLAEALAAAFQSASGR